MTQKKLNKVIKGLKKASKTHAQQAKTLDTIKMKKGGSAGDVPKNVANPSLYRKAKAKAKAKFDVYPSAYANGWMVQEYKRMGGKYKGAKKAAGGSVEIDEQKSDLNKDGRLSKYERARGTAIAKSMAKKMNTGGSVMVQGRGCGAIMPSKQKKTRVPRG
jgi:hypothetical protein|tara:strand:+ start:335 stop:814 length:480 start_codon:yes stop_codon:yes gene_type:complete